MNESNAACWFFTEFFKRAFRFKSFKAVFLITTEFLGLPQAITVVAAVAVKPNAANKESKFFILILLFIL